LQGFAISVFLRGFLFPALPIIAGDCIQVRVKLGSSVRRLRVAASFANQMCQALAGPPNRRGDVPTRDFHLCGDPPIPFTKTDNHAGVAHVALTSMHRSGAKGSSVDPTRRSLQNAGYRLPRIPLPRTPVNKGKEKAGDPYFRTPASLPHHLARGKQGLTPSAVKRCYLFGLITPQVAGRVASWGSEGSSSLLPAALKS
jgi:hypothetical protein